MKDKLLCLLINFLKNHQVRVVLNDQFISWTKVNAGVPQGSILESLLFSIYINDLPNDLQSNPQSQTQLFADDTSCFLLYKKISPQALSV